MYTLAKIDLIGYDIKITIDSIGDIEIGVYQKSVYYKKVISKDEADRLIEALKMVK